MSVVLDYLKKFPIERAIMIILLAAACIVVIKILLTLFDKMMKRSKLDALVTKILRVIIKGLLWFLAIVTVLASLGISVTSLVATLSIVGVALSLAIQDFLGNVFGGLQIISNKPFKIGDYIEAAGTAGTVREVGLFYTKLDTPDKKLIQIPNSKIANDNIVNYSNAESRRVEFLVSVSYDDDVELVRETLLSLLCEHPMVYVDREGMKPVAHVKEFRDNDVCYVARAWCDNKNYWTVYFDVMDAIKPTFAEKGIAFSYPHVNVHMVQE